MTLKEIEILLAQPADIVFGKQVDVTLRTLQEQLHPDRFLTTSEKILAEKLFKLAGVKADELRRPPVTIKSPKRTYSNGVLFTTGDISDIYTTEHDGKQYLLKISRTPGSDQMLEQEMKALATLHTAAGDTEYRKYFPLLVESFPAHDKIQRRVNVFVRENGWYTLNQVQAKHDPLSGRHIAWIFKRLLIAIGFAHRFELVHGAILPRHVMVRPDNHGLMVIGWGQSVCPGQRITKISTVYKDWYPKEVFEKKMVTTTTDIYMAAQLMARLVGANASNILDSNIHIPMKIKTFLRSCLMAGQFMRPDDAWAVYNDFEAVLKEVYGPPKFVDLSMS